MNLEISQSPRFPVNLSLFNIKAHNPSFHELAASLASATGSASKEQGLRDFCVPVNPYFPTPEMYGEIRERLLFQLKYYPPSNGTIAGKLAQTLGLRPETVVLGNGSTELITWIDRLFIEKNIITSIPTFGRWTDQPKETGKEVFLYRRRAERDFHIDVADFVKVTRGHGVRVAVISNPNNPTGALMSPAEITQLVEELSDLALIVIDESFIEFASDGPSPTFEREASRYQNVMVLKSLGKNFGLHGVRLGYCVGHPVLIKTLADALPKWNINGMGELLIDLFSKYQKPYLASRQLVVRDRILLETSLRTIEGLVVYPSRGNFVYIQGPFDVDGITLRNRMLTDHGIFIRECGNKVGATSNHFRIATRPAADTGDLVAALRQTLRDLQGDEPRVLLPH